MWKPTKTPLLLLITWHCISLQAQKKQQDFKEIHAQPISQLAVNSRPVKESFLSPEYIEAQNLLLLESKRNIKKVIQEKEILKLENTAQRERLNAIMVVLILLLLISSLAIYSYLKVKRKNKLLMSRVLQFAQIPRYPQEHDEDRKSATSPISSPEPALSRVKKRSKKHAIIDKDVQEIILSKLEKLEKQHFYLDANCSLHQLAEQLKTNPKYLSQVINQGKKSNFNNYINELRINYLLSKLLTDIEFRNSKLHYIAVSLGYNNLNTFNAAFKKRMGFLPSYFIEELNLEKVTREEQYSSSDLLNTYN